MDEASEKLRQKVKEIRERVNNDQLFTNAIYEQLELRKPSRPRGYCWCCFTAVKLCWVSFLALLLVMLFMYCYRPAGDLFMKYVVNNFHVIIMPIRFHYINLVLPYIGEWWGLFNSGCLINVPSPNNCICKNSRPRLRQYLHEGLNENELYVLKSALDESSVVDVWHLLEHSDVPPFVCLESCSNTDDNCVDKLFTGKLIEDDKPWTVTWQECTETTDSYQALTPNLDFFLKEWSQKYLFTVSNQWGVSMHLQEMSEYDWAVIAVLDGNLKLKIEPSSDCVAHCGDVDLFVTLQARDIFVFNGNHWNFRGQAFSTGHLVYYTSSFNMTETNILYKVWYVAPLNGKQFNGQLPTLVEVLVYYKRL